MYIILEEYCIPSCMILNDLWMVLQPLVHHVNMGFYRLCRILKNSPQVCLPQQKCCTSKFTNGYEAVISKKKFHQNGKFNLKCGLYNMMTSSNGNIFRVTGPLCGEFTGPGEFPTQRPVTRSFDVFFHLRLNKRLSKHSWGWWFETLS